MYANKIAPFFALLFDWCKMCCSEIVLLKVTNNGICRQHARFMVASNPTQAHSRRRLVQCWLASPVYNWGSDSAQEKNSSHWLPPKNHLKSTGASRFEGVVAVAPLAV
jgi:hypothetical protein